ncbi:MAG TPA: ATP synthase F1 subunit epsilon [Anaerolineaceae bacterium]|nr:ATP synthase F1 subunit epsilon [Anaerolineaceae bacterium]
MPIQCDIVSQDRMVFSGEAEMVILPGSEGVMGVLPNHSPVLTTFNFGIITVVTKKERNYFTVAGGIAEVRPDLITVLADAAENVDELDVSRAEQAKERAEKLLKESKPGDVSELDALRNSLRKSTFRLEAIKRFKRSKSSLKDR